jgi:hypothetical protein
MVAAYLPNSPPRIFNTRRPWRTITVILTHMDMHMPMCTRVPTHRDTHMGMCAIAQTTKGHVLTVVTSIVWKVNVGIKPSYTSLTELQLMLTLS